MKPIEDIIRKVENAEKNPPQTMDELNDIMSDLSACAVLAMVSKGVDHDYAMEIAHLTINQAGLYYVWRKDIEEKENG